MFRVGIRGRAGFGPPPMDWTWGAQRVQPMGEGEIMRFALETQPPLARRMGVREMMRFVWAHGCGLVSGPRPWVGRGARRVSNPWAG
eukprot:1077035-Pyramimonas_sp.AAC.1